LAQKPLGGISIGLEFLKGKRRGERNYYFYLGSTWKLIFMWEYLLINIGKDRTHAAE
jgi:hypothetical protein